MINREISKALEGDKLYYISTQGTSATGSIFLVQRGLGEDFLRALPLEGTNLMDHFEPRARRILSANKIENYSGKLCFVPKELDRKLIRLRSMLGLVCSDDLNQLLIEIEV